MSQSAVYKILTPEQDERLQTHGQFEGAPIDIADGYIHLSASDQVAGTLAKHFPPVGPLILLALDPARMPPGSLKWEVSRGGALFPHLYAPITSDMIRARHTLDEGRRLPKECES